MLEISNYGELKQSMLSWLDRRDQDTIDKIPLFINFAEKEFTRILRLPYYEVQHKFNIQRYFEYIDIPNDFLILKHLMINGKSVTRTDVETYNRLINEEYNGPRFFCRIGSRFEVVPKLEMGDNVFMVYYKDIPEMKEEIDAPYSLIIAPDVLLYLALRHASIYLRDNQQEEYWLKKAQEAAVAVQTLLEDVEWKGSTLRIK